MHIKMDINGQVAWEYLLIMAITLMISLVIANYFVDSHELNLAISAARSGALGGASVNGVAIYPEETFKVYEREKPRLLAPSSIKIIKIESINQGFSEDYQKIKIQLKIHASCPALIHVQEKNSMGDRINFNARKSIAQSFKTENLTNALYNPVFSPKYVFTTADVKWV